ncbi:MAG: T9SS type A sorting domain-containing protein, partial [Candidatus Eisenbacteria bacterium]|nr:T9SS type A sorting domain-containing protein [Candidatus Eisenbacteria bacterium]
SSAGAVLAVWPNPARSLLSITFAAKQEGARFRLALYDVTGRFVGEVASGSAAGTATTVAWEIPRDLKEKAGPGVYFVVMESEGERLERKVLLLGGEVR